MSTETSTIPLPKYKSNEILWVYDQYEKKYRKVYPIIYWNYEEERIEYINHDYRTMEDETFMENEIVNSEEKKQHKIKFGIK